MVRTCFHSMSAQTRQYAEVRANDAIQNTATLLPNDEYINIGITVHIDIPFDLVTSKTSDFTTLTEYALHIVNALNQGFNNTTSEFLHWAAFESAQEISSASGLSLYKAQRLYDQLHSPIIGNSKISFVLRQVNYDSTQNKAIYVDPYTSDSVHQMKVNRWPRDVDTLNVWVSLLGSDILGFATFPFTNEPQNTFGVVID